jgi:hypothetical protein
MSQFQITSEHSREPAIRQTDRIDNEVGFSHPRSFKHFFGDGIARQGTGSGSGIYTVFIRIERKAVVVGYRFSRGQAWDKRLAPAPKTSVIVIHNATDQHEAIRLNCSPVQPHSVPSPRFAHCNQF